MVPFGETLHGRLAKKLDEAGQTQSGATITMHVRKAQKGIDRVLTLMISVLDAYLLRGKRSS